MSRPRDKRTDYRGAAEAARERGMNRLAERLLEEGALGLRLKSKRPAGAGR